MNASTLAWIIFGALIGIGPYVIADLIAKARGRSRGSPSNSY